MKAARGYTLLKLTNCVQSSHLIRPACQRVPSAHPALVQHSKRTFSTGHAAAASHGIGRSFALPLIAGAGAGVTCGTAAYHYGPGSPKTPSVTAAPAYGTAGPARAAAALQAPTWVCDLAVRQGILEVLNAETLRTRDHPLLSKDHMFSALVRNEMVQSLSCFYAPKRRQFYSVIELGSDVCGYKRIVHGGLTAAICDETFGGLLFALRKQRALPFFGPAFTAQLDMTYKGKIPSSSAILCTAEVESIEGRKIWMRAIVSDGPDGRVYATARALFVAPKPQRLIHDGVRLVFPSWPFGR